MKLWSALVSKQRLKPDSQASLIGLLFQGLRRHGWHSANFLWKVLHFLLECSHTCPLTCTANWGNGTVCPAKAMSCNCACFTFFYIQLLWVFNKCNSPVCICRLVFVPLISPPAAAEACLLHSEGCCGPCQWPRSRLWKTPSPDNTVWWWWCRGSGFYASAAPSWVALCSTGWGDLRPRTESHAAWRWCRSYAHPGRS